VIPVRVRRSAALAGEDGEGVTDGLIDDRVYSLLTGLGSPSVENQYGCTFEGTTDLAGVGPELVDDLGVSIAHDSANLIV
jgi:hypothetical protein